MTTVLLLYALGVFAIVLVLGFVRHRLNSSDKALSLKGENKAADPPRVDRKHPPGPVAALMEMESKSRSPVHTERYL